MQDELFGELFMIVYQEIIENPEAKEQNNDEGTMPKYTAHFLRAIIKSL